MSNNISEQKSIAGLRANAAAFIVNLSFFTGLGLLIPIFALIVEDKNSFVRAYSKQTLAITVVTFVSFLLNFIMITEMFVLFMSIKMAIFIYTVNYILRRNVVLFTLYNQKFQSQMIYGMIVILIFFIFGDNLMAKISNGFL